MGNIGLQGPLTLPSSLTCYPLCYYFLHSPVLFKGSNQIWLHTVPKKGRVRACLSFSRQEVQPRASIPVLQLHPRSMSANWEVGSLPRGLPLGVCRGEWAHGYLGDHYKATCILFSPPCLQWHFCGVSQDSLCMDRSRIWLPSPSTTRFSGSENFMEIRTCFPSTEFMAQGLSTQTQ